MLASLFGFVFPTSKGYNCDIYSSSPEAEQQGVIDTMTAAVTSVVPIADTIRTNSVCGNSVVSTSDRRLQEEALTFAFEIAVTEDCIDGACSDSDEIQEQTSSSIQSTLSSNVFEVAVQEEAVANAVTGLTNAVVESAEVTVVGVELTTPEPSLSPTIAPTDENVCVDSGSKFYNPLIKEMERMRLGCQKENHDQV